MESELYSVAVGKRWGLSGMGVDWADLLAAS